MTTILDKIITVKVNEVERLKKELHLFKDGNRPKYSFIKKLKKAENISIIAEFKRASPSKGDINPNLEPIEQITKYVNAGADAISILTDSAFFKGSFKDVEIVRNQIKQPILCKEFIIDPIQIDIADHVGADLILLIAAALDDSKLNDLYHYALERGLEVLMEVHNEIEAERVLKTGNQLIGINNRNLKTFKVDLSVTEKMAPMLKKDDVFIISESGIKAAGDVQRLADAGVNGILVGETFMVHPNFFNVLKDMKIPLKGM